MELFQTCYYLYPPCLKNAESKSTGLLLLFICEPIGMRLCSTLGAEISTSWKILYRKLLNLSVLSANIFGHFVTKIGGFSKLFGNFDRKIRILVITKLTQVDLQTLKRRW